MEKFPPVIDLNVGGTNITTRLSTLTKEPRSMLATMFSGRHVIDKDKDGRYFIDSNGRVFSYIIDFLRDGTVPPKQEVLAVYNAAAYFGIESLQHVLEDTHSVQVQKKMKAMKTGSCAKDFDYLKSATIRVLEDSHSFDTKYVEIKHDRKPSKCPRNYNQDCVAWSYGPTNPFPDYLAPGFEPQRVVVNFLPTDDLIWCLKEELIVLGYGAYAFDEKIDKRCEWCPNIISSSWKIMLSFHKIVKDENNKFTLV